MAWKIEFDQTALKDLQRLERHEQICIHRYLYERIAPAASPRDLGKALQGERYEGLWRYRIGDYRLICQIKDKVLVVLVLEAKHRGQAYR